MLSLATLARIVAFAPLLLLNPLVAYANPINFQVQQLGNSNGDVQQDGCPAPRVIYRYLGADLQIKETENLEEFYENLPGPNFSDQSQSRQINGFEYNQQHFQGGLQRPSGQGIRETWSTPHENDYWVSQIDNYPVQAPQQAAFRGTPHEFDESNRPLYSGGLYEHDFDNSNIQFPLTTRPRQSGPPQGLNPSNFPEQFGPPGRFVNPPDILSQFGPPRRFVSPPDILGQYGPPPSTGIEPVNHIQTRAPEESGFFRPPIVWEAVPGSHNGDEESAQESTVQSGFQNQHGGRVQEQKMNTGNPDEAKLAPRLVVQPEPNPNREHQGSDKLQESTEGNQQPSPQLQDGKGGIQQETSQQHSRGEFGGAARGLIGNGAQGKAEISKSASKSETSKAGNENGARGGQPLTHEGTAGDARLHFTGSSAIASVKNNILEAPKDGGSKGKVDPKSGKQEPAENPKPESVIAPVVGKGAPAALHGGESKKATGDEQLDVVSRVVTWGDIPTHRGDKSSGKPSSIKVPSASLIPPQIPDAPTEDSKNAAKPNLGSSTGLEYLPPHKPLENRQPPPPPIVKTPGSSMPNLFRKPVYPTPLEQSQIRQPPPPQGEKHAGKPNQVPSIGREYLPPHKPSAIRQPPSYINKGGYEGKAKEAQKKALIESERRQKEKVRIESERNKEKKPQEEAAANLPPKKDFGKGYYASMREQIDSIGKARERKAREDLENTAADKKRQEAREKNAEAEKSGRSKDVRR